MASRDWWEDTPDVPTDVDLSVPGLLSHWDAIETDFHHMFGVDLADGVLGRRRWPWFLKRVTRLLSEDSALARAVGLRDRADRDTNEGTMSDDF